MKDHNDWVCNWMDRLLEQDSINAQVLKAPQTQEISSHLDQFPLVKNAPALERQKIMESVAQLIESAEGSKHLVTMTVHIVFILNLPTNYHQNLNYSLYITDKSGKERQLGRRGVQIYGEPDLGAIINEELSVCPGKLLISGMNSP